jgi:two-component system osmolarity sensor histidine kinase EnvZ
MLNSLSEEVNAIVKLHQHKNLRNDKKLLSIIDESMHLKVKYLWGKKLTSLKRYHDLKPLELSLKEFIKHQFIISYINDKSDIIIEVELEQGLLQIIAPGKMLDNPTTYIFILWMTGAATIFLILSIIFIKNQLSSISKLAIAAEKFGKGRPIDNFKPSGAKEVRKAATAFLKMKDRIERQISQRTELLAGVSHDLRTPLTRIKLQLAMMGEHEEIIGMQQDIQEMEHMIEHYLNFARGEEGEKPSMVNINELLANFARIYKNLFVELQLVIDEQIIIQLKNNAFKRALSNILDNSVKYASNVRITACINHKFFTLEIDDDGPGISKEQRDLVFKPFYRVDKSRNSDTGGVGLGLSISKDIINSHGGKIFLSKSELKGLKVILKLPL